MCNLTNLFFENLSSRHALVFVRFHKQDGTHSHLIKELMETDSQMVVM